MSELFEKRKLFSSLIPKLIDKINETHIACIGKDGLRHRKNSLHYDGLAMDIDLYNLDGTYLKETEDHKPFGLFWESIHPDCFWGGNGLKNDGLKNDGNHYSVTYQNKK